MASDRSYQTKQTSFAGGRFSPELYGRTDLAKYNSAFKDSKNFFISPEGALLNRAGMEMVGEVTSNNQQASDSSPSRLIPFIFSDDDVVILAFGGGDDGSVGSGFVRFYSYDRTTDIISLIDAEVQSWRWVYSDFEGQWVHEWVDNSTIFPWTGPQAVAFRFVQSGDVIYITYEDATGPLFIPFKLTRTNSDSTVWRHELFDINPKKFPTYGGTPRLLERHVIAAGAASQTSAEEQGQLPPADDSHPARPWSWAVSRIMRSSDGKVYESLPFIITESVHYRVDEWRSDRKYGGAGGHFDYVYRRPSWIKRLTSPTARATFYAKWYSTGGSAIPTGVGPEHNDGGPRWDEVAGDAIQPVLSTAEVPDVLVCYTDRPMVIDWRVFTQQPEDIDADEPAVIATRIYKGREGFYGFIGQTGPDAQDFIDDGIEPDFATPPRTTANHLTIPSPFPLEHPSYVAPTYEWPSVLSMYEGRFVMAATLLRPGLVVGSAVEDYFNIDEIRLAKDADPYAFNLASQVWEKIRFIVPRHGMYIFTSAGEWVASGSGQFELLTPNSKAVRQVSSYGSSKLQPLIIGETVMFIENTGCEPRAFFMQGQQSKSIEIAGVSRFFFRNRKVVSWCWSEVPWQTMWLQMDDGKLLSCCWNPEQQMVAWAEHEIQGGSPISVISIPADNEHAVVMLVQRGSKFYMERMSSRMITDVRDSKFLDGHVFYDGRNTSTNEAWTSSIASARAVGDEVYVEFTSGTEAVEGQSLGLVVRVYGTNVEVTGTDETGADIETETPIFCDVLLTSAEDPDLYLGQLLTPLDEDMDAVHNTVWELCRETVNGLEHFENAKVTALVDGEVIRNLVVSGGSVVLGTPLYGDLGRYGAVICVGLGYDCDVESLAMAVEKGRPRIVKDTLVETYGSRGGYVGQSLDDVANLAEVVARKVQHEYGVIPLLVEETPTTIKAAYDIKGEIGFRQSDPLPISITSIVRDVEFGER